MPAEGRWTTWSDEQDAPHIARLDVPGNEGLELELSRGAWRRPTHEELLRAIQWTDQHPEWRQEVEQEMEEIGADRYAEGDTGTPSPGLYLDSHTGNIVQADHAPDPQFWWRLAGTEADAAASLARGEPAVVVPLDFPFLSPAQQIEIAGDAITQQYGDAEANPDGSPYPEGRFRQPLLDLQRKWGVSPPPEEAEPMPAPGPASKRDEPGAPQSPVALGGPVSSPSPESDLLLGAVPGLVAQSREAAQPDPVTPSGLLTLGTPKAMTIAV